MVKRRALSALKALIQIGSSRCSRMGLRARCAAEERQVSGGHSDGVPPVPIPNTVVKAVCADDTWGATPWENRSPPE